MQHTNKTSKNLLKEDREKKKKYLNATEVKGKKGPSSFKRKLLGRSKNKKGKKIPTEDTEIRDRFVANLKNIQSIKKEHEELHKENS